MPTGFVKWFNSTKGYGFIRPDDGSEDAFVHITALERSGIDTLHENQRIAYELDDNDGRGKSCAVNLRDAGEVERGSSSSSAGAQGTSA